MEYLKVKIKQNDHPPSDRWLSKNGIQSTLSVKINGEINGRTGRLITVQSGQLEVSLETIYASKADIVKLDLPASSTTITNPKEVVINVYDIKA